MSTVRRVRQLAVLLVVKAASSVEYVLRNARIVAECSPVPPSFRMNLRCTFSLCRGTNAIRKFPITRRRQNFPSGQNSSPAITPRLLRIAGIFLAARSSLSFNFMSPRKVYPRPRNSRDDECKLFTRKRYREHCGGKRKFARIHETMNAPNGF